MGVSEGKGVSEGEGVPEGVPGGVPEGEGETLGVQLPVALVLGVALPSHAPVMATLSTRSVLPVKFKGVRAQQKPEGLLSASAGKAVEKGTKPVPEANRRVLLAPQCVKGSVAMGMEGAASFQMLPLPLVA